MIRHASSKSGFLEKVLGRLGRLDTHGLQTVVQRLARERNLLETLFNTIEDGVLVVDEEGRLVYFNQAATGLFGWQAEAMEGEPISRVLPEVDWQQLMTLDKEGGHRVIRHEFEVHYPKQRFLRLYAAPLDGEATGSTGLALVIHDATVARQATFEAIESERIQALTLLAASVAHEIGNPLNALHIHLQLMDRELTKLRLASAQSEKEAPAGRRPNGRRRVAGPDPEVVEAVGRLERYLGVAKGEIRRLDYIVTQFLQAIRPSAPHFREGSLNDVVVETIELLGPELSNRGLLVEQRCARQLPIAHFDPVQIKQVLVNLIKNAMQATTKGGLLTIETGSHLDGVWVSVQDTGAGIPQDQTNRIFEPFYTTKKKGSGLGLMIVQRIVREHGGRLELESHVGKGTRFRVWLPLKDRSTRLIQATST